MTGENVFLTGATGNAGQYVRSELFRRGMAITALVRKPIPLEGCRQVVGELAAIDRLSTEISAASAIIHLASPRSYEQQSVLRNDVLGTRLLINAWRKGPFIYASTGSVCEIPLGKLTESSPVGPENWYQMARFVNEFQIRMASTRTVVGKGAGICLRPGSIFTSGDRRNDRQGLSAIYKACLLGRKFVFDSEKGLEAYGMSFMGGADFGRAVAEALKIRVSGIYNVASGDFTFRQLIEAINKQAGTKADFLVRPDTRPQTGEFRVYQSRFYLDTTAFREQTGFVPQQSWEELLEEFVQAERAEATAQPA